MLKLKLQYFGYLMWRTDSFEKTLMLGKIEVGAERANRGWNGWMVSLTRAWVWVTSSRSWWWTGRPGLLQSMLLQRVRLYWATELNWTVLTNTDTSETSLHQTYGFFPFNVLIITPKVYYSCLNSCLSLCRQSLVVVRKQTLLAKSCWPVGKYFWSIIYFKTKHEQDLI